jgi:SAM-dependent methyltransferase
MTTADTTHTDYDDLWRDLWANAHAGGPLARTRYRIALRWLQLTSASRERVLDVGAGNAAFIAEALRRSPQLDIFGVEFSQTAIDLAHPAIRHRLARCDLQATAPIPWGGNFQSVTCMEVLEHLPDDACAMNHLAGALAPGGYLFISVPAWQSLWGPQDVTAGHVRRYEPLQMRECIELAGLELIRLKCWGGLFTRLYRQATDLLGPRRIMSVRPDGVAGAAAMLIYNMLKMDDFLSFGAAPQLFVLARKPPIPSC